MAGGGWREFVDFINVPNTPWLADTPFGGRYQYCEDVMRMRMRQLLLRTQTKR